VDEDLITIQIIYRRVWIGSRKVCLGRTAILRISSKQEGCDMPEDHKFAKRGQTFIDINFYSIFKV